MTPYEELADLGAKHSLEFYRLREDLETIVYKQWLDRFVSEWKCPQENVCLNRVDPNTLEPIEEKKRPHDFLVQGRDGFFYFQVELTFGKFHAYNKALLLFGIIRTGTDQYLIRAGKDTPINSENDFATFFQNLFQELREDYQRPQTEAPKRFGFQFA